MKIFGWEEVKEIECFFWGGGGRRRRGVLVLFRSETEKEK